MALSSTVNKVVCLGNGATTVFSYNFRVDAATDFQVVYTNASGVETVIASNLYSVTGIGNASGGTLTYPLSGSPIATGTKLTISRVLPLTQTKSLSNQGASYPTVVEAALDRIVMQIQQIQAGMDRALIGPVSDLAAIGRLPTKEQRAGQMLGFDANGDPVPMSVASGVPISSAMQPVVAAATTAAARTAMGIGALSSYSLGRGLQDDGAGNVRVMFSRSYKTANYNVVVSDHMTEFHSNSAINYSLPQVSFVFDGFRVKITVPPFTASSTITPNAADTIFGGSSGVPFVIPPGSSVDLVADGGNYWLMKFTPPAAVRAPGGYLTLQSYMPVYPWDVIGATNVYYTHDVHGFVPINLGGASWNMWAEFPFSELTLALNASNHVANQAYDVFVALVDGQPTIMTGPGWRQAGYGLGGGGFSAVSNTTPITITAAGHGLQNGDQVFISGVLGNTAANGIWIVSGVSGNNFNLSGSVGNGTYKAGTGTFSCRGIGAGTSEWGRVNGVLTNRYAMTCYNGSTSYSIGAYKGTYLGTILINGTAGQISCTPVIGQNRRWGVWNAYNRKRIIMSVVDPAATWTYASAAYRSQNGSTSNRATFITGLPEETVSARTRCNMSTATSATCRTAIGWTTSATEYFGGPATCSYSGIGSAVESAYSEYNALPTVGSVAVSHLESSAAGTTTFVGGSSGSYMTIEYRG